MKLKKTMKAIFTLALSLILCLGSLTTVFAAGVPITANETDPALTAGITKMLNMPEGTNTPAATFSFTITPKTVDGVNYNATTNPMPALGTAGTASVTYSSTNAGNTTGRLKSVPLETGNILPAVTAWPHAGVYVYEITENANTYTAIDNTKETMTYSGAKYQMTIYVANKTDGSGLYVAAIGTTLELKDDGTEGNGKVDPTPGTSNPDGDYSQLIFTNVYTKTNGGTTGPGDPVDPPVTPPGTLADRVLSVSKTVAGKYGDQSKDFVFNLTLTKAATFTTEQTYRAYVVDGSGAVVTSAANYTGTLVTDSSNNKYINVTTGTAIAINLKHGQKLVFTNVVVGTDYVATETAVPGYTTDIALKVNGVSSTLPTGTLTTGTKLIGEGANSAAYTNTNTDVTPTGISLNNLPFIMMIVLAAVALVGFVAVKSRKNSYSK